MRLESAEMSKHAINSFLAVSVVMANELAVLCERVGADAREVERGLKTESRIGPKAYLRPGAAFAGGTLARDVRFLTDLSRRRHAASLLLNAALESNDYHKGWARRILEERLKGRRGGRIALIGLTYKAGTDTLRRSWMMELSHWLLEQGVKVQAFDWTLHERPAGLAREIELKGDCPAAMDGCDGMVVGYDHPGLKALTPQDFGRLRRPLLVDPEGTLRSFAETHLRPLDYCSVGLTIERA
jgi:UDPglucose 6-dehydrogenase